MSITYKSDILNVSNVTALFNLKVANKQLVQTRGYSTEGIGSNLYRYDASSTATIDGGFTLPGLDGTLSFSGTTFNGTGGVGRFIAVDQTVADVTKFGAIGDGTTDAWSGIQRAVNKMMSLSGKVYLPRGTYLVTQSITLDTAIGTRVSIDGDGPKASIIARAASFTGTQLLVSTTDNEAAPAYGRTLEGCTLKDFSLLAINGSSRVDVGMYLPALIHSRIERVWSSYAGKVGIVIGYNYSNTFEAMRSDNSTLHGIVFLTEVNNQNSFNGCVSVGNGGFGWAMDGGKGLSFQAINVETNAGGGMYFNRTRGVTIAGGYFEVNGNTGHVFTTFNGGAITGGDTTVKADIILNGANSNIDASTFALPDDCSRAFASQVSVDAMSSYRNTGVSAVAFFGSEGTVVNNLTSRLVGGGALGADFIFHGVHSLQLKTSIGRVNSEAADLFSVLQVDSYGSAALLYDVVAHDVLDNSIEFAPSGLTSVVAGSGGTYVSTTFKYSDGVLYKLGATGSDGVSTDYYGGDLFTYAYPGIKGKYATLVVDWYPAFAFDDTYASAYNGSARLIFNGYTNTASVASSATGEVSTTGTINSASNSLVVASATGIAIGDYVLINGAGAAGVVMHSLVVGVSGTTLTLTSFADTTVTGGKVHTVKKRTSYKTILIPSTGTSVTFGVQRFLGKTADQILIGKVKIVPLGGTNVH